MVDWVKKLTGELIDIIQWLDDSNNTLVYRFERLNNEIKYGAKLTVREGQMAVFINEGQLADVYKPGMYTLTTQNMPILATLKGWKYGFESPFKAEVYFVSTRKFTDMKWGTPGPATMRDKEFGIVRATAGAFPPHAVCARSTACLGRAITPPVDEAADGIAAESGIDAPEHPSRPADRDRLPQRGRRAARCGDGSADAGECGARRTGARGGEDRGVRARRHRHRADAAAAR